MDISKISDDRCFNCEARGHIARECPKPKRDRRLRDAADRARGPSDKKTVVCDFCDFKGHTTAVCRKLKQYKEEQQKKNAGKRIIKKTEEEEEEEDDYDGDQSAEEGNEEFADDEIHAIREDFQYPVGRHGGAMFRWGNQ